jgi:hypothetical protein
MKTLIRGVLGVVLAASVIGGGCEDDPQDLINPPDTFSLSVGLLNQDTENIHIFREVFEDFLAVEPVGARRQPGGHADGARGWRSGHLDRRTQR